MDADGPLTMSVADTTVSEGEVAKFVVTLSGMYSGSVTATYSTMDDTAQAPADYEAATTQTLSFAPEKTAVTISVDTVETVAQEDDPPQAEASESFKLTLTLPSSGVLLGRKEATATIIDNDPLVVNVAVMETVAEGTTAEFLVTLDGGVGSADVIVHHTVGGTLVAGTDYDAPSGMLTISARGIGGRRFRFRQNPTETLARRGR